MSFNDMPSNDVLMCCPMMPVWCREFEAYIFEVKKLPGLFGQGKAEVAEYFRTYIEDYNTGKTAECGEMSESCLMSDDRAEIGDRNIAGCVAGAAVVCCSVL
jgi:hypothetical protein